MSLLEGKKVILGITGGIAAYKSAFLLRLLIKEGAEVQVIFTHSALNFVTPLTFSTLSKKEVLVDFFDSKSGSWHNHVELGKTADAFIIAPATANSIAQLSQGFCENILQAVYLSSTCKVFAAPAMDIDMYKHPSLKRNLEQLENDGVEIIPAGEGELASGYHGEGRMAEPEVILEFVKTNLLQ